MNVSVLLSDSRIKAMALVLEEVREVLACAEEACCGRTGPELETILRSKLQGVEARIQELKALRVHLQRALASVPEAVERNRGAMECQEEICLPQEVGRARGSKLLPLVERQAAAVR